ncbi:Phosphonate ABC transporter, permease component [Mycoplasma mycoides subsp. capri LC str. 95010]|uniref:Phosphonate ABC transporter, permease component n=1 Tax=Mycoplasma mycoides subsp. capri LC str. 95010 TaxID=862259 RepID=F4MNW0_MYCML|nr:ABC transporter permease subunit [Mycoplasma mycoides]CBW53792.1 Phosphonate ABC transporter, permease component [Mycoplasma mycoides subsp. capri LC str. 95010]
MLNKKIIKDRNLFKIGNHYTKPPKRVFTICFTIGIIIFVVLGFALADERWSEFFDNFDKLVSLFKDFFKWDLNNWNQKHGLPNTFLETSFYNLWQTIKLSFIGTFLGIILCLPFSVLASRSIVSNRYINNFSRGFLSLFRTIPSFAMAMIIAGYFLTGYGSSVIGIIFFSFSVAGKLFYEKIEQIDTKVFTTMQATGANKFQSFRKAVVPQISTNLLSISLYTLETNIRYFSVIAIVTGLDSYGELIKSTLDSSEYSKAGFLLTIFAVTILLIELFIFLIRNYIIEEKDYLLEKKLINKIQKPYKNIDKLSNVQFYINYILTKEINDKIAKTTDPNELQSLKLEKKKLISEFKKQYTLDVKKDKEKYKKLFKENKKNLFVKVDFVDHLVRIDKITQTKLANECLIIREQIKRQVEDTIKTETTKFKKTLTPEVVLKKMPKTYIKRIVFFAIILFLFIFLIKDVNFSLASSSSIKETNQRVLSILNINWESLYYANPLSATNKTAQSYSVLYILWETLTIAILGTVIGAVFAYILGLLSSSKIVHPIIAKPVLCLTTLIRAIPTYMYAYIFVFAVGVGPFAGSLALAVGTIGMLTKYNREVYETINFKIVNQLKALGLNKFQVFRYGIFAQTQNEIISYIIYRFEINFKEVATLGIVGAGRLGSLLKGYFEEALYAEFGALVFGLIIFTLIVESISNTLRVKFLENKNPKWIDWLINKYQHYCFATYKATLKLFKKQVDMSYWQANAFNSYVKSKISLDKLPDKHISKKIIFLKNLKVDIDYDNKTLVDQKYQELISLHKKYIKEFKDNRKLLVDQINQQANNYLKTAKTNYLDSKLKLEKQLIELKADIKNTEQQIKLQTDSNNLNQKLQDQKTKLTSIKDLLKSLKKEYKKTVLFTKQTRTIKLWNLDY